MKREITYILERLGQIFGQQYPDWQVADLAIVGSGLDTLICQARSAAFGAIAIKVPWRRWVSNKNDPSVDARELLRQEAVLSTHLAAYHVATPRIHAFHEGDDDFDFLVSELIMHDESKPDDYEFGALMRAIHESPPPQLSFVMQGTTPLHVTLAERLTRRLDVVAQLTGTPFASRSTADIQTILEQAPMSQNILHMDARPENLLVYQGKILAIIDWSNALLGDAALDLARIAEYGYLSTDFLRGYGNQQCFAHLPRAVELLYRLDTATMLTVVFLSENRNLERGKIQFQRVCELYTAFEKETR